MNADPQKETNDIPDVTLSDTPEYAEAGRDSVPQRIELVANLAQLMEQIDRRELKGTVNTTRHQLIELIRALEQRNMSQCYRARTFLKALNQSSYFQKLERSQAGELAPNILALTPDAKRRHQRRVALQSRFKHICPRCNSTMTLQEHPSSRRSFWKCMGKDESKDCRVTHGLSPAEQVFMST